MSARDAWLWRLFGAGAWPTARDGLEFQTARDALAYARAVDSTAELLTARPSDCYQPKRGQAKCSNQ